MAKFASLSICALGFFVLGYNKNSRLSLHFCYSSAMSQYCDQPEEWGFTFGHIEEHRNQTILWRIENFFALPPEDDFFLISPVFFSASYYWYLKLYPNGKRTDFSRGCFELHVWQRNVCSPYEAGIQTVFRRIGFHEREELWYSGIRKFLLQPDLLNRRDEFLPGGTLTIWIRLKHEVPLERLRPYSGAQSGEGIQNASFQHGGSKSSSKTIQRLERRLEALRAYNKYKEELSLPGVNKTSVWEKMAATVRRKFSFTEGDYGLHNFHSQMLSLKREYERKRNNNSCVSGPEEEQFLKEAQLAFGDDSEFPESYKDLNSKIQESETPSKTEKTPIQHHTGPLAPEQATTSLRTSEEKEEIVPTVERPYLNSEDYSDESVQIDSSDEHAVETPCLKSEVNCEESVQINISDHAGTRITYDRDFLMQMRNSPIARTPPKNLPNIPRITRITSPDEKPKENKTTLEKKQGIASTSDKTECRQKQSSRKRKAEEQGSRIAYDRDFLMQMSKSPIAQTPPKNLPYIPRITSLNQKPKENSTTLEKKQGSKSSSKSIKRLEALRAYNMYKEELSLLGVNKTSVWKKMAATVREKYSVTEGNYGLPQFRVQILSLKREYELLRKNKSCVSGTKATFLKEAQLAFEDNFEIPVETPCLKSEVNCEESVQVNISDHAAETQCLKSEVNCEESVQINISDHAVERPCLNSEDHFVECVQIDSSDEHAVERPCLNSEDHSDDCVQIDSSDEHAVERPCFNSEDPSVESVQIDSCDEHAGLILLSDNFRQLILDEESDVTIDVKGKIIKAHKLVLKVRSKGLFSMLKNSGTEDKNLVIKIEDCEPEAFEIFFSYLYTGKLEKLSATNILDLYDVAVKFDVTYVKAECVKCIKRSMTMENLCSVTQVARKHGDSELLKCVTDYFLENVSDNMGITTK